MLPEDEAETEPVDAPVMATTPATIIEPEPVQAPEPEPAPVLTLPPNRPLASWLAGNGLDRRVRLQRGNAPVLLIDPRSKIYHGPATLKPLTACFEGTLLIEEFQTPTLPPGKPKPRRLGAAQPLVRLQWLGGLLAGDGELLPGNDPNGQYRLTKWPQTEREYPKHFRIATAMMKGPFTLDEVTAASGVERAEIVDFVNANLTTGYAERVLPAAPEPEPPTKTSGGLFGRMRGR